MGNVLWGSLMREVQTGVLIVGSGPTGMVTALCLSRLGIPSIVVERQSGLQTHPKAHELSGRSIEILGGLGIGFSELAAEASPDDDASRILFCETINREFGCIDLKAQPDAAKYRRHLATPSAYLNLSQVELERILVGHVQAAPHTQLCYGHQWNSLEQRGEEVLSQVTDLRSGDNFAIRSRYVVASDGAGSRCRGALGIQMVGPEKLRDFVNAYFEADLSQVVATRGKLYFIFNPEAPGVFIAHHVEKRWVYHTIVATPHEKMEDFTPEVMRTRILAALGQPDIPVQIKSMSQWRMTAQVATAFRSGRVFLAGDAAHRFPPTGGLGMNSGIGDAHNLSWKLAKVMTGQAPETLLDSYELERRPVVQTLCDESRHNYERMSEILDAFGVDPSALDTVAKHMSSGPVTALPTFGQMWIRRQLNRYGSNALARFHKHPEVERKVLEAIANQQAHFDRIGLDLGCTYERGAILPDGNHAQENPEAVRVYIPSTRPGSRFPHFWLDGNCRQHSSLEWVDYSYTTLVLGEACGLSLAEMTDLRETVRPLGVRVIGAGDTPVPPSYGAQVHQLAQIEADGALMIRPDGYVSWRQKRGVKPTAALVQSIMEQTCHFLA